jgi:hypothetical protein
MPRPEDPGRPSSVSPKRCCCVGFRCVKTVAVCFNALTRLYQTSGTCAFPCGLHGSLCTLRMLRSVFWHLLHIRNTRYEWLVRPYSAGTCTLQEAPSFAWRTNAGRQARLEAEAQRTLEAVACTQLFGQAVARGPMGGRSPHPSLTGSISLAFVLPQATQGYRRFSLQRLPHPPTAWAAGLWLESRS